MLWVQVPEEARAFRRLGPSAHQYEGCDNFLVRRLGRRTPGGIPTFLCEEPVQYAVHETHETCRSCCWPASLPTR